MVSPTRSTPAKKKRRVSVDAPDVVVAAIAKRPAKALTPVAAAVAALAKRRNDAQQVSIAFDCREKFPIGTKLLLPQSIYPKASDVSWLVVVCFRLCFLPSCVLSKIFVFLLSQFACIGSRKGTRIPFRVRNNQVGSVRSNRSLQQPNLQARG
jgi:hypothetical protein